MEISYLSDIINKTISRCRRERLLRLQPGDHCTYAILAHIVPFYLFSQHTQKQPLSGTISLQFSKRKPGREEDKVDKPTTNPEGSQVYGIVGDTLEDSAGTAGIRERIECFTEEI